MRSRANLYRWFQSLFSGDPSSSRGSAEKNVLNDLGYTVMWLVVVALLSGVLLSAIGAPIGGWMLGPAFVGLCGLVTLTAAAVGGVAGFLFGIPRMLSNETSAVSDGVSSKEAQYARSNTNLEQISDWLTKIVVGATLVQINLVWPSLVAYGSAFESQIVELPGFANFTGIGGLVPLLVILGFTTGFLALYLQTRTFLAILFARTEHVMKDPKLGLGDLDLMKQAVIKIALEGEKAEVSPAAREIARRALGSQSLNEGDVDALRQRGFAQVVMGLTAEGATTLKKIYEQTGDEEIGRIASRLLARTNRPGEAKDMLPTKALPAADVVLSEADADFWLTRMFVSLYDAPPLGFNESLRIGESLAGQAVVLNTPKRRGRLAVYTAAALGQCYAFPSTGGELDRQAIRDRAYENVQQALTADPATRGLLKNMLLGEGEDDDLVVFRNDEAFAKLILEG